MLWLLITLFLLYPIPAFAQTASPNIQALVGGFIVRNPDANTNAASSIYLLGGSGAPSTSNTLAQIKATLSENLPLNPGTAATGLVEIWINKIESDWQTGQVAGSKFTPVFSVDRYGSISSEHGRMVGASDFHWNNKPGSLKLFSRSLSLSEVNDAVDLVIGRSSGTYPYGPFQALEANQNIGQLAWSAFNGSDFKDRVAQIYARNEAVATEEKGAPGSLYFATTNINSPNSLPQDRMVIKSNGNIGIGLDNPLALLHVNGDGLARGSWRQESDIRLKENIVNLSAPLEKVLGLRGVGFEYKDKTVSKDPQIGLIAQEVEEIVPEVVSTDEKGYKSVSYQNLVPLLIEAIKNQQKQLDIQKQEIDSLKGKINN